MTQAHIHLMINHLPIFGSIIGAFILMYGTWTKSSSTKSASYFVLIASALGAVTAYLTGEGAEDTVKNIIGVAKTSIDAHEDFAIFALISCIILGLSAIIGLFLAAKKQESSDKYANVVLIIALLTFLITARTGYLGGQIRHTELDPNSNILKQVEQKAEEMKDEINNKLENSDDELIKK